MIFVGGTICTTITEGTMQTDSAACAALIRQYRQTAGASEDPPNFHLGENFGILSENMTIARWNQMIAYVRQILPALSRYDGIIVAHGTDTLAYSAALFSVLLKGLSIPVMLVSSHQPIVLPNGTPNPAANGVANFAAAVRCIEQGIAPNIYVPYQNPKDGIMYLHKGSELTQCPIYDDNFYGMAMRPLTDPVPAFDQTPPVSAEQLPIMQTADHPLTDCVLKIDPYVGLNYDRIGLDGVKAVLHGVYHSGTACVDDGVSSASLLQFFRRCADRNIPLYFAPAKTGAEQTVYASIPWLEQARAKDGQAIRFCYGHTQEWLYAALLYGYSVGLSDEAIDRLLQG